MVVHIVVVSVISNNALYYHRFFIDPPLRKALVTCLKKFERHIVWCKNRKNPTISLEMAEVWKHFLLQQVPGN